MRSSVLTFLLAAASLLAGCERLGLESPEKLAAAKEADGRAVGGACRHAGRAIEDCYAMNRKADRAAVFAGWREMNDYMRENKLEAVPPQLTTTVSAASPAPKADAAAPSPEDDKRPAKAAAAGSKAKDGKSHDS